MSIHWDIQTRDSLPSTQDLCKDHAQAGAAEGFAVQARVQTAGRGRHGREWVSGEGNLSISFILRPDCSALDVGQISILVGVALAQAIKVDAVLKWPNDVLLGGRKCAGILMDSSLSGSRIEWLVVGIGVNTADAPAGAAALGVDRDEFLALLLVEISLCYQHWQVHGFEGIRQKWLGFSHPVGTTLNVGIFEDLDGKGNLVVRDGSNALKTIAAGDVYLKDADYAAGD